MTELEERLRREFRELEPRPGSIRPLRVPPPRRFARTRRWAAPVAAAAAVAIIVAVATVGTGLVGGSSAPTGRMAPMTGHIAESLPRYYVVAFQRYIDAGRTIATYAAVHDTATGALLASVRVPTLFVQGGSMSPSITGAADDQTFVLMESGQTSVNDVVWCFLLRVSADGRSLHVSKLLVSVPSSMAIDDAALSPDGTRLAMSAQWACSSKQERCDYSGVRVVDLATGAVTSWTTQANGAPFNVAWAGNDALAFQWQANLKHPPAGQRTGYRLLDVSARGGNLLASRAVASPPAEPSGYVPAALVTPDGQDVITSEVQNIRTWNGRVNVVARVLELDASTGRTLRVLYTTTVDHASAGANGAGTMDQECNVLALGPTATEPLVACFLMGVLVHGELVTLPGIPSATSSGIAGQDAIAW
jgi:hypothetical protein